MRAQESKHGDIHLLRLSGGTGFEELLTEMASYTCQRGLSKEGYGAALVKRELHYPTALQAGMGVAIPHADPVYACQTSMIVAVLDQPAAFRSMGGGEEQVMVEVVFLLLIGAADKHLELLSAIADFIQQEKKMQELKEGGALEILTHDFESLVMQGETL